MRRSALPLLLALTVAIAAAGHAPAAVESQEPLKAVPALDLARYAGTWHEVARLPLEQEEDCVREITATYTLRADGRVDVRNQCTRADGTKQVAEGIARRGDAPGKLEVRFAPDWLAALPFVWGDYWVIAIDDDYRWAIVGEPDRDHLWFLTRDATIDDRMLEDLKGRARMHGYDLEGLIVNPP